MTTSWTIQIEAQGYLVQWGSFESQTEATEAARIAWGTTWQDDPITGLRRKAVTR